MTATWPTELPQCFLRTGYEEETGDGLIETQPEAGPPATRRRSSAAAGQISGQMALTSAQKDALRTFVDITLGGGALPFRFPSTSPTKLLKFQKAGLPKYSPVGGKWTAAMKLWVLP